MRVAVAALILVTLTGCGEAPEEDIVTSAEQPDEGTRATDAETPPDAIRPTIGFSAMTLTNPFFRIIADTLTQEAQANGFEVVVNDGNRDPRTQSEQIDSYIARGVAAIVLNPCNPKSVGPAIRKANAKGIPVFTCDLECTADDVRIAGHVGTDNFQGGKLAGQAMIEALGQAGGKVLILHYERAESCLLRVDGFRSVIDEHNRNREDGWIEVVAVLDGGGLRDEGFQATSAALQSDPDLSAIFAINDPSGLGAWTALKQAGREEQITIIAFDGHIDGRRAIKEGRIYADPIQFPDRMGRITMQNIIKYLNGEPFEARILIPTRLYRRADAERDPELQ